MTAQRDSHPVRGIDLATLGASGAAVAWGDGGGGTVIGLVQRRGRRLSARVGIALRPCSLESMARSLLRPGTGGSIVPVQGADAPRAALDLVLCRRGDDAARLAGLPDATQARAAHREAAAGLLKAAFGDDLEAAFFVADAGLPAVAAEPLLGPSPHAAAARAFVAAHPFVAMAVLSKRIGVSSLCAGEPVESACAAAFPGLGPAHLRRLAGIAPDALDQATRPAGTYARVGVACETLALIARLPPDWVPDADTMADAATVALVLDSAYVLDPGCLTAMRGDWTGLVQRLRRIVGVPDILPLRAASERVRSAARDLGDASAALCSQLLLPLAANAHAAAGLAPVLDGPEDLEAACLAAARDILYGGRGMAGAFEVSARWHARQDQVAAAFMNASADMAWAVPFPGCAVPTAHGVVEIVPLGDALSLHEEGRAGRDARGVPGLDHCVFGRLGAALRGEAHVISLRKRNPDGGYERLSTAQIDLGPTGFTVREHQGLRNGEPPPGCVEALEELARRHADVPLDVLPRMTGRPDPVRDACGYDWRDADALERALRAWEPLLPRRLRGLGVAGMARTVPGLAPGRAPEAGRLAA